MSASIAPRSGDRRATEFFCFLHSKADQGRSLSCTLFAEACSVQSTPGGRKIAQHSSMRNQQDPHVRHKKDRPKAVFFIGCPYGLMPALKQHCCVTGYRCSAPLTTLPGMDAMAPVPPDGPCTAANSDHAAEVVVLRQISTLQKSISPNAGPRARGHLRISTSS